MSYDFTSGSWGDSHTGHQAATYSNPADPVTGRKTWSANDAAKYHVLKGASANKINIGVAFYGRGFKIANNVTPAPFVPSLGGLLTGTFETNVYDYGDLKKNYITSTNVYYDEVAQSPYIFDTVRGHYISFDNKKSVTAKVQMVVNNDYEGVFSWEMSGDSDDFELTSAMG